MNGWVTIGTKLDTKQLEKDIKSAEAELVEFNKKGNALATITSVGKGAVKTIGGIATGILSTIGSVVKGLITGIARITFMAFGVSTALGAISLIATLVIKAFTKIVDENKELLANIRYIVFVITNALTPAVNSASNIIAGSITRILNLLAKVITYIAYIIKAWFGVDILAGASVDKFREVSAGAEDTAKGLGKASKNAKDLKKQLAGFDEMNVLQDDKGSGAGSGGGVGGGGAGGGFTAPTLELGGEVPEWIKWIAENKDLVIAGLLGIAGGLIAIKLGLTPLMGLGIGIAIAGIYLLIKDIIAFIKDPTWETFANILRDLGLILVGISITLIAINATNPVGWIMLIVGAVILLVSEIIKHWGEIKEILGKVGDWIKTNVVDPVVEFFKDLWEKIKIIFEPFIAFFTPIFETWKELIKTVVGAIINIVTTIWTNIKTMVGNIKTILTPIVNFVKDKIVVPVANFVATKISDIKTKISDFVTKIKGIFSPLVDFFKGIIDKIGGFLKKIGSTAGNVIAGAFKGVVNSVLGTIETVLNSPIRTINSLIGTINEVPGISLNKLSTFKLPRMAKGGIVNMPGRGVLVGSAIAGERGAEGVIPLTDSQQMALLGEAIGKYITVNANITNTMNGRVISRELQKVQSENDFAFNR